MSAPYTATWTTAGLQPGNKDLPRKIKFKTRYKHSNKRNKDAFAVDRTYDDYRRYMAENPGKSVVEMDTVIGKQEKAKCF